MCAECGHELTDDSQRIDMQGRHEHRFLNPAGFVYDIQCFRAARGVAYRGEGSDDFSWFPPYSWRVAVCGECHMHVGWGFDAPELPSFVALIVTRIAARGSG